jgi:hypothetical protein
MRDSTLDPHWLAEMVRMNSPKKNANGILISGPVRLSFPNLFKPWANPKEPGKEGKFGATLMFPIGADLTVLSQAWIAAAREAFPKHWDQQGQPVGLHIPFHDQNKKAVGLKPRLGYTPGAIYLAVNSKFKPAVVDVNMNVITDESRVYPGVWAIVGLTTYKYDTMKTGIGFGLQTVMIIADDTRLAGGGGNPQDDFAGITITAQSNVADKFMATAQPGQETNVLSQGGFVGQPGSLPIAPIGAPTINIEDLM